MRLVAWFLVAMLFFYGVYQGFMTVWSYMEVADVVERAADTTAKITDDRAGRVRDLVLAGASESGVPLDDRLVSVTESERVVTVQVRWRYPVVAWRGEPILTVPLSIERSYGPYIIR